MKKRPRVPGIKKPTSKFQIIVVGGGHCDTPGCNCANEHDPTDAFAYTFGLHDHGLPELRLSALPKPCSEMPVMPSYELGRVLDCVARGLADGKVDPVNNGVRLRDWPGGFTVYVLIEGTVDRDAAECYRTDDDATVREIEWCAHRDDREVAWESA
jgi:hypothetical protein